MINAKRAYESLAKNLGGDAEIIKEFAAAIAFPAALLSIADPTPLAIGSALLAAAAAGVKSFSKVLERLEPKAEEPPTFETSYERFKVAYYTLAQRSVIESILKNQELTRVLQSLPASVLDRRGIEQITRTISERAAAIQEAELRFHYTVAPTDSQLGIYGAYKEWLVATLKCFEVQEVERIASAVIGEARTRFRVALAASDRLATWMRNYLALEQESRFGETTLIQLSAIRDALEGWKEALSRPSFRPERWDRYREYLRTLPDQKETMYNEAFGVSRVFVSPRVRYNRVLGTTDTPQDVPDVGRLVGALVSTRLEGSDLIILSGGPGSGKSTLCRMIASELARDGSVHPVFLRLRRQREGADVTAFIEEYLVAEDVITKLADLHQVPNLIIILDGFDELAMASKTKLRTFFNSLLDATNHGPLRNAKIIVSGRDTLFPGGVGLPRGSHVLTVLPFDRERVTAWGGRWRAISPEGQGASFFPEVMLDPVEKENVVSQGALHQLATWPLTLHLIAQLHTAGRMAVGDPKARTIEKAYLYRAILAETARRQIGQAEGRGRLEPDAMRKFLRAIAWEMYVRSTDTLEVEAVVPIVKMLFPRHEDAILHELSEVSVVNAPEIKKGEETGFEFVHKSFAEFLVAECIGQELDAVAHRVEDVSGSMSWHQSTEDAAKLLLARFGPRLIPIEVEDMLRPMIGGFKFFARGENVEDLPDRSLFVEGLGRVLSRTQEMYRLVVDGRMLSQFEEAYRKLQCGRNPLEIGANFAASVVLIGSAAADRLRQISDNSNEQRSAFMLEPVDGGMWRWLFLMAAGGVQVDEGLARRLFKAATVLPKSATCRDFGLPVQLGLLSGIEGYESNLVQEIRAARDANFALTSRAALFCVLLDSVGSDSESTEKSDMQSAFGIKQRSRLGSASVSHFVKHLIDLSNEVFDKLLSRLIEAGMVSFEEAYGKRRAQRRRFFGSSSEIRTGLRGLRLNGLMRTVSSSLCQNRLSLLRISGERLRGRINEGSDFIKEVARELQESSRDKRNSQRDIDSRWLHDEPTSE